MKQLTKIQIIWLPIYFLMSLLLQSEIALGAALTKATASPQWHDKGYDKSIVIEIGQDYHLKPNEVPNKIDRIWVENSRVISVETAGNSIKLKSLAVGQTRLRTDGDIMKVSVVPIGSLKSYREWTRLSQKFIDLQVEFCESVVCLKGKVFQLSEYKRLLQQMSELGSTIYFAFELHPSILKKVQIELEQYQREHGLTPLRVVFSKPWKVQFGNKDLAQDYRTEMAKIGILAIESKQKVDIGDNVRVSIRVTELKNDFGRTLGVKYPGTYSAQVLDNSKVKLLPFDVSLNANETSGNVKVLASPNLVCRSGKEAEFFAGGEFPIRVLNFRTNDVVWKKYGIGLKVKPVIDSIGQMSLQIESEVSSLDESTKVDGIPGLHTHKVSSTFDLIRSRTIALSGLLKNEQGESSEGIPFLRQLPILGRLFSSHDFRERRTELVIFVTPELMEERIEASP